MHERTGGFGCPLDHSNVVVRSGVLPGTCSRIYVRASLHIAVGVRLVGQQELRVRKTAASLVYGLS